MIPSCRMMRSLCVAGLLAALAGSVRGDDVVVAEQPPVGRPQQQAFTADVAQYFDSHVFSLADAMARGGNMPTGGAEEMIAARLAPLRQRADARIARVDRVVGLSDAQRKKLEIAAQSDMRRLVDAIVEARGRYAGRIVTRDPRTGGFDEAGQQLMQEASQDWERCRQLVHDAFGPQSLLAKVVVSTLDEQQARTYAAVMRERSVCRWKAVVAAGLTACDGQMGFTQKQYDAVTALLVADPPPLEDDAMATGSAVLAVVRRLALLGDEKLATLLDPRQRQLVALVAQQAAGGNGVVAEGHVQAGGAGAVGEFKIEVE